MNIDLCTDNPALGEAILVLGPLDVPPADDIDDRNGHLIFRWERNQLCMGFFGDMTASVSWRDHVAGTGRRVAVDFLIADPIPQVFWDEMAKIILRRDLTAKQIRS